MESPQSKTNNDNNRIKKVISQFAQNDTVPICPFTLHTIEMKAQDLLQEMVK